MRLRLGNKHHLRKSADRKAQVRKALFAHRTDLCFSICRFSQVVFIPQAQPHAQSLFLFPIVFGINLILCVGVWVGWKFWVWEGVCSIRCVFRELNKNNVFSCFTENACLCMLQ